VAPQRFDQAIAAIDRANAEDPNLIDVDGRLVPKELAHARMVTDWVRRLDPDADEAQLLAARAHHLRRWEVPRSSHPEGRAGYLRWRAERKRAHAEAVAEILGDVGYEPELIERVRGIVTKRGLGTDPAVQTHEDALCLVFLQTQLSDVAPALGRDKTVSVLAKTLVKMSARGRAAAEGLDLNDEGRGLLADAGAVAGG
jgi:hypothetical protein